MENAVLNRDYDLQDSKFAIQIFYFALDDGKARQSRSSCCQNFLLRKVINDTRGYATSVVTVIMTHN